MSGNIPSQPSARVTLREVLNKWFWVNYAVTLLATSWIPLLSVTPSITLMQPEPAAQDNTGELSVRLVAPPGAPEVPGKPHTVTGPTTRIPLYTCYYRVAQGDFKNYALPVAIHLSLCFLVSFWIWRIVLKAGRKAA